jgi:hypothetical protein
MVPNSFETEWIPWFIKEFPFLGITVGIPGIHGFDTNEITEVHYREFHQFMNVLGRYVRKE